MAPGRPEQAEYAPSYADYVTRVPETDVVGVLARRLDEVRSVYGGLSAERARFRYAPGKWSAAQILGHLTDGERVFGFRAFWFSRGDGAALPGFDENAYVAAAPFERCEVGALLAEFELVRRSHLEMFRSLDEAAWRRVGTANESPMSVRAVVYVMAGHVRHHLAVLHERYGV